MESAEPAYLHPSGDQLERDTMSTSSSTGYSDSDSSNISVSSRTVSSGSVRTVDTASEDELVLGRIPIDKLLLQPGDTVNARSKLLQLHQQTGLVSPPVYGVATKLPVEEELVFGVQVALHHYHLGDLTITGYGTKVALARECAARGMLNILEIAESDLTAPPARLEPAPLLLSDAVIAGRAKRRAHLAQMRIMAHEARPTDWVLFVDVEMFDGATRDHQTGHRPQIMLEVGLYATPVWTLSSGTALEWTGLKHCIISEHVNFTNTHCPDKKFDLEPRLGTSMVMSHQEVATACRVAVDELVARCGDDGRKYLVGHSVDGDRKWMKECLDVDLDGFIEVDIADAYAAREGRDTRRKLTWLSTKYGMDSDGAHNAGNDVAYTAQVCGLMLREF